MTLREINHGIDMLNRIDAVLENVQCELNYMTLLEDAATDPAEKQATEKKKVKLNEHMRNLWTGFCEWLERVVTGLLDKITYMARVVSKKDAILSKDLTVSKYVFETIPGDITSLINDAMYHVEESDGFESLSNKLSMFSNKKITKKKGDVINIKGIYSSLTSLKKDANKLKKNIRILDKHNDSAASGFLSEVRNFYKTIITDIRTVMSSTMTPKSYDKKNNKDSDNTEAEPTNESYGFGGVSRNEFIANLMLEAADLLKDDVVRDNSDFEEFEDVPEERPVEMDDYITSVNGGDDEDPELDEIEDLCDGDKEVMALLTDDEDKSVTVDATNESALNFFDLDF